MAPNNGSNDGDNSRRFQGGSPLTRAFWKKVGVMSVREERAMKADENGN